MDDGHNDDRTQSLGRRPPMEGDFPDPDAESDAWSDVGARRGPRHPAEGVRIIGAEEAAAAIQSGNVSGRVPDDAPRFGDVPSPPEGPRPSLRFPGADPAAVPKPPVAPPRSTGRDAESFWSDLERSRSRPADPPAGTRVTAGSGRERVTSDDSSSDFWGLGRAEADAPPRSSTAWPSAAPLEGDDEAFWSGERATTPPPPPPPTPPVDSPSVGSSLPHWTEPPTGETPRILDEPPPPEEASDDLAAWSSLSTAPRWRDQPTDWDESDFDESVLDDEQTRVGALATGSGEGDPFSFEEPAVESRQSGRPSHDPWPPSARVAQFPAGGRAAPGSGGTATPADISSRVVTGLVALGVLLVAAAVGPGALVTLVGAVVVVAAAELHQALRVRGYQPATLLGLVATASLVGAVYWKGLIAFPLVLGLFIVFSLLWYLTGVVEARPTLNVAVSLLAFLYVGFLGSFAALLLKFPFDHGIGLLLGAVLATAAYDIGAFAVGRWAGRTPLAPDVSPGKTVEGLVGATFATLVACLIVVARIDPWNGGRAFWLAVVVSIAAPLGDLCESLIKRDLDVKDMGSILPGHGGILDRIDSLLFVIPATYYLVQLLDFV